MILPSDPLVVPQPGFRSDFIGMMESDEIRSGPVSDLSTWVLNKSIINNKEINMEVFLKRCIAKLSEYGFLLYNE
jgi:hypothetical protein